MQYILCVILELIGFYQFRIGVFMTMKLLKILPVVLCTAIVSSNSYCANQTQRMWDTTEEQQKSAEFIFDYSTIKDMKCDEATLNHHINIFCEFLFEKIEDILSKSNSLQLAQFHTMLEKMQHNAVFIQKLKEKFKENLSKQWNSLANNNEQNDVRPDRTREFISIVLNCLFANDNN